MNNWRPIVITLAIVGVVVCVQVLELPDAAAQNAHATPQAAVGDELAVSTVLDWLHQAASEADGKKYFDLFTDDAVFLGTDETERWTIEEFKAYAMVRFETGMGWTYTLKPGMRHIVIDGSVAWFDELLENKKYGTCRGSGVVRRVAENDWKIAQYNLTFTVPNEKAEAVMAVIRGAGK